MYRGIRPQRATQQKSEQTKVQKCKWSETTARKKSTLNGIGEFEELHRTDEERKTEMRIKRFKGCGNRA